VATGCAAGVRSTASPPISTAGAIPSRRRPPRNEREEALRSASHSTRRALRSGGALRREPRSIAHSVGRCGRSAAAPLRSISWPIACSISCSISCSIACSISSIAFHGQRVAAALCAEQTAGGADGTDPLSVATAAAFSNSAAPPPAPWEVVAAASAAFGCSALFAVAEHDGSIQSGRQRLSSGQTVYGIQFMDNPTEQSLVAAVALQRKLDPLTDRFAGAHHHHHRRRGDVKPPPPTEDDDPFYGPSGGRRSTANLEPESTPPPGNSNYSISAIY